MKKLLYSNRFFFVFFLCLLIVGAILLMGYDKGFLELRVNRKHHIFLDYFFKGVTYLGDGAFYLFLIVLIAFIRVDFALFGLMSFLVSGGITQLLKRWVFPESLRPKLFFQHMNDLYFVEGVTINSYHSFPSGHSTSAFALACFLSILFENKKLGLVFGIIAFLSALSRVYLLQHFIIDIYFGAIIGVVATIMMYHVVVLIQLPKKGIINLINKK